MDNTTLERKYVLWMGNIWSMSPILLSAVRERIAAGLPPDIYSLSQDLRTQVDIVKILPERAEVEPLIKAGQFLLRGATTSSSIPSMGRLPAAPPPARPASRLLAQPPNVISIKALRFEVAGCHLV